jgi:hypothetical protein
MPIIPALGTMRKENYKFKASLGYSEKPFPKNKSSLS